MHQAPKPDSPLNSNRESKKSARGATTQGGAACSGGARLALSVLGRGKDGKESKTRVHLGGTKRGGKVSCGRQQPVDRERGASTPGLEKKK